VLDYPGVSLEGDCVFVQSPEFGGFPDLGVDSVVQADESEKGKKTGHHYLRPVSERNGKSERVWRILSFIVFSPLQ